MKGDPKLNLLISVQRGSLIRTRKLRFLLELQSTLVGRSLPPLLFVLPLLPFSLFSLFSPLCSLLYVLIPLFLFSFSLSPPFCPFSPYHPSCLPMTDVSVRFSCFMNSSRNCQLRTGDAFCRYVVRV